MAKLSDDRQEKFCNEFVIDLNGAQAAIRAGYSKKTAREQASRLLTKVNIQQRIAELKQKTSEKLEITHDEVTRKLKQWVESDITETIGLTPEEIKELPLDIRRLVTKYKHTVRWVKGKDDKPEKEEVIELHFVSKERAIEMVNRHIGYYEADNRQKGALDVSKLSAEALKELVNATS